MTRAVRDRILKEANGDISDHLRNHIHLTNCIHLKNHMHKHSPILADRSLMRDLIVLQRSRSLRDPSASSPSWQSPSITDLPSRMGEGNAVIREGRRSVGTESRRVGRTMPGSSSPLGSFATSKVVPAEVNVGTDGVTAVSEHTVKSEIRDSRRIRREESSRRSDRNSVLDGNEGPSQIQDLLHEVISRKSESKDRNNEQKDKQVRGIPLKTLSEQLKPAAIYSEDIASSSANVNGRRSQHEKIIDEPESGFRGNCSGLNRVKRRKFRGTRRSRKNLTSRDGGVHNELSVASNTLAHGSAHSKHKMEEENENYANKNVTGAPRNGCGMPWNWSSIHHRGKTFLDMAGRSFSCGLSDSVLQKGSSTARGRGISDTPIVSDHSSSPAKFEAEALPLLVEASGSQENIENAGWQRDYSGELGIFADNYVEHEVDSDLASEARCSNRRRMRGHHPRSRHQNLTQKYMPRTFKDLVGQNLVAQALSNAVLKKKVGLLYVFYGPHGAGKTSCARIFARALNCQSLEHSKPCGLCNSCIGYDVGKSRNIREVAPVSNLDFESIMELLDHMIASQLPSQYTVFIFDDCDSFSSNCWNAIIKVIDRAPRRLVFVFVCSSPDVLPHIIISRCQKFFFPKLKDADVIHTLQWIATQENLEIDKDALKLITSRSDGSLRDAEMTLEQLSLLGQRISVPLIQELVGLISDEKLIDLLDLALSADTVNTVKNLRLIIESGVEPMALMSQIATVITDILAGSYDFNKERPRRKFFRRQPLSKEDMEKLRQALKTLSEAEKQLRMSNDKLTWLTAALLQLAPDQQYMLSSSAETSFNHSPLALNNVSGRGLSRNTDQQAKMASSEKGLPTDIKFAGHSDLYDNRMAKGISLDKKRHSGVGGVAPQQTIASAADSIKFSGKQVSGKTNKDIDEIWLEALGKIRINSVKEFFIQEGKLASVSFGAAPTVRLIFNSHHAKSKAEKLREHILQAFESALCSAVIIEIRCESKREDNQPSVTLPASKNGLLQIRDISGYKPQAQLSHYSSGEVGGGEIVEIDASPREAQNQRESNQMNLEGSHGEVSVSRKNSTLSSISERREGGMQSRSQSIVRSKVSLAHVIQQAEGCSQRNGWSKRKAVTIAEKLEQENLRLEPQSRSLFCWKASRVTRRKLSRLKIRTRRPQSLLKFVSCGKCLSA